MLKAVLKVESSDAGAVLSALQPEVGRELLRTNVSLTGDETSVTLVIDATDTSAMRAALNSYLGCIRITEDISRITR
ncbi:MAG: hypothetical protein E7Z67_03720 [Thermoplasmata archaeon]|nr:hypothetical protein [Thermoplasmata archaeon]